MTVIIPTTETTPLIDQPPHRDCPVPPGPESALVAAVRLGPSGLGTSAFRITRELTLARGPHPAYQERPWGDGRPRRYTSQRSSGRTTRWPPRSTTGW